jgi:hypothetical protein
MRYLRPLWILTLYLPSVSFSQVPNTTSPLAPPDDVIYRHVFRHVARYQELADAEEMAHRQSPFRHSFRTQLGLNPVEEQDLNFIAAECGIQLKTVQSRVSAVVAAFRAAYPIGKLKIGVILPPPPVELSALEDQKKAIVLAARDRLRTALGEVEFARVDTLIKSRMVPYIAPASGVR